MRGVPRESLVLIVRDDHGDARIGLNQTYARRAW